MREAFRQLSVGLILLSAFICLYFPARLADHWALVWSGRFFPLAYMVYPALSMAAGGIALFLAQPRWDRRDWPLGMLALGWLASSLGSNDPGLSLRILAGILLRGAIPGWVIMKMLKTRKEAFWMTRLLLALVLLIAVVGLRQFAELEKPFLFYIPAAAGRVSGTLDHPLPFSSVLLGGMALSFVCFQPSMILTILGEMVSGAALIFTFSRSSWIIAGLLFSYVFLYERTWRKRLILSVGSTAILCALTTLCFFTTAKTLEIAGIKHALVRRFGVSIHFHNPRFASYAVSRQMVRQAPFLGTGLGTFPEEYCRYQVRGRATGILTPDNLYLRLMTETGFVGLALWLALLMGWFRKARRRLIAMSAAERDFQKGLILSVLALLASSLFFDSLYWPANLMVLSLLMGLSAGNWQPAMTHAASHENLGA